MLGRVNSTTTPGAPELHLENRVNATYLNKCWEGSVNGIGEDGTVVGSIRHSLFEAEAMVDGDGIESGSFSGFSGVCGVSTLGKLLGYRNGHAVVEDTVASWIAPTDYQFIPGVDATIAVAGNDTWVVGSMLESSLSVSPHKGFRVPYNYVTYPDPDPVDTWEPRLEQWSAVHDINQTWLFSYVVGYYLTDMGYLHPYVLMPRDAPPSVDFKQLIPSHASWHDVDGAAHAINGKWFYTAVGCAGSEDWYWPDGPYHAFVGSGIGSVIGPDVAHPNVIHPAGDPFSSSCAFDVNDHEFVVGALGDVDAADGFIWTEKKGMINLNLPDSNGIYYFDNTVGLDAGETWEIAHVRGINENGQLAANAVTVLDGWYRYPGYHAVLLTPVTAPSSISLTNSTVNQGDFVLGVLNLTNTSPSGSPGLDPGWNIRYVPSGMTATFIPPTPSVIPPGVTSVPFLLQTGGAPISSPVELEVRAEFAGVRAEAILTVNP